MLQRQFIFKFAFVFSLISSLNLMGHEGEHSHGHYVDMGTTEMKKAIDADEKMVLIDARPKRYDDGERLPGAIHLPFDASEEDIYNTLPIKDAMIVIYCVNKKCPASRFLADRLVMMGYTEVYRYSEGLAEWRKQQLPIVTTN